MLYNPGFPTASNHPQADLLSSATTPLPSI